MNYQILGRLLLSLTITVTATRSFAQNVILGVLEESKGHYAGEPNYRDVRVIFQKTGDVWQPFPSNCDNQACLKSLTSTYPDETTWTIAFDGKNLGQVASHAPSDFRWYSDIGQQAIISANPVPTVGTRSAEFGGYTEASVYRPLVANSKPYFADPEQWKPFVPSSDITALLQQAFRKKFPKLCRTSQNDQSKLNEFSYRNEDIKVVKAYASRPGSIVARLHLEAVDCQDTEAGFDIDDPWFFVDATKTVKYFDSGMWLVDAGDYDNDGRSELIFSINREDEGGYEIWYENFTKHATFKFIYH
ncbi:MAG TPA: hypothetical protein VMG31_06420 [Verrucomicrobiae bacterium]|nr:hypothetical protein [Verrucomicrobiae bacterium]